MIHGFVATNGAENVGPGFSSLFGFMMGNGPYKINPSSGKITVNQYAWNEIANVIFLHSVESPAGVGFSNSDS